MIAAHRSPHIDRRRLCAAAAGLAPRAASAQAAAWPQRPVRLVVNAPAGGTADVAARIVGEGMSAAFGQPFIVDAKGGGSGTIGIMDVLRSPPDGYTLLVSVDAAFTEVPHSVKVSFDPLKDMRPVADIYLGSLLLIDNDSVPAKRRQNCWTGSGASRAAPTMRRTAPARCRTFWARSWPRRRTCRSTTFPIAARRPAMKDLVGGQVPLMFNGIGNVLPQLKTGKIRVYAIAAEQRSEFLPDVPTFKELGYPELMSLVWMGLWAQPQVSAPIVERLHAEVSHSAHRRTHLDRISGARDRRQGQAQARNAEVGTPISARTCRCRSVRSTSKRCAVRPSCSRRWR